MRSPFSFRGELGRVDYLLISVPAFFAQHAVAWGLAQTAHSPVSLPRWFWFAPLGTLSRLDLSNGALLAAIGAILLSDWILVAAAVRRGRRAGDPIRLVPFIITPFVQLPTFLWLALAPQRPSVPAPAPGRKGWEFADAALGLFVGAALCVVAVLVSGVVFGRYGFAMFLASPLVIAASTAYIANRKTDLSDTQTIGLVMAALFLGAMALLSFAIEGLVCLVMASPLIAFAGLVGALIGRAMARAGVRRRASLSSFAFAPIVLVMELVLPPHAGFDSVESIEVAAPPAAVWDAVVHMGPIPEPPAAPFRWGLAYPIRGRIWGEGVGAIRQGVFSTGIAYERVTGWRPERELDFIVLSDPPTMSELSPYPNVRAPHDLGYFRTRDARFTITPLRSGMTRLTLATRHELDLEPALYWLPLAKWATHANKVRVLRHFKAQAEVTGAG